MLSERTQAIYSRRAGHYDFTANLYYLIGARLNAYREEAIQALNLQPGSTVLELGCGTGLNFPYLQARIGEEGCIIGVDLTPAMLEKASERVQRHGWNNVELIQADASRVKLPSRVDAVLSTFALSIMADYQAVIEKATQMLVPGGRMVILDLKLTHGPLRFLNPLAVLITKPFAGSYEAGRQRAWQEMQKHLIAMRKQEYYFGFVYIASGTRSVG